MENYIYHYTGLEALIGIVSSDPNRLTFWGSRYDCMNDPLDYQFARNRLHPHMMAAVNELADELKYTPTEKEEIETTPYILSFSKKKDDFLMWRMYKAKVALVLERSYFEKTTQNSAFIECEYVNDNDNDIRHSFLKIDKKIRGCSVIAAHVDRISTFIKEKSFEPEDEIRFATWIYYDNNGCQRMFAEFNDNCDNISDEIKSRINGDGKIILYKTFHFDKKALKGIIVHSYSQLEFESIQNTLRTILLNKSYNSDVCNNITNTNAYPFFT